MGEYSLNYPGDDAYTVSSRWIKAWLPAATSSGGGAADTDQQEFLADAPPVNPQGTARNAQVGSGTPATSTITVSTLKSKITEVSNWLAENGGSDEQVRCIESSYASERYASVEGVDPNENYRIQASPIQSGLAAGTVAWSDQDGTAYKAWRSRLWLDDAGDTLFEVQTGPVPPFDTDSDGDGTNDLSKFERRLHLVRPLPAGTHSFQVSEQWVEYTVCDGWVYRYPLDFIVSAPADVVAESFFDPTVTGSAIGGTTTLGTVSWEAGRLTATLNRDIAGHALDFIGLDGSVEVLLKAADATRNGTIWTWTMSSQPWQDGGKLMVRLYQVTDTTCSGESVPFAACVLTFSPASYAFSVLENAAVGHAVGAVSATSPTAGATVRYSLTAGNADGKFAIGATTGQITVAAALDSATVSSYTLTVSASDGSGETATATVTITVAS